MTFHLIKLIFLEIFCVSIELSNIALLFFPECMLCGEVQSKARSLVSARFRRRQAFLCFHECVQELTSADSGIGCRVLVSDQLCSN